MTHSKYALLLNFILLLPFCCWGCSSDNEVIEEVHLSFLDSIEVVSTIEQDSIGRMNAVKKAHQMTDLTFTPKNQIACNSGYLQKNKAYKGLIYSSVKEIETYVGNSISFYTFMTAINNPRSKIYTEQINTSPYHGVNCKAYYGTVCSDLVSYALGLNSPRLNSFDFPESDLMKLVDDTTPEYLEIADVLWKKGHVALITDIEKGDDGIVKKIEICEAIPPRCRCYYVSRQSFVEEVMAKFQRIYRYWKIGKNTDYKSANEFVAVCNEVKIPFVYNNDLCVDKGDKANYLESEKVTINIMNAEGYIIEVYKDNKLYLKQNIQEITDYSLENLSYGDYKARIKIKEDGSLYSDYTCWKVVNADIHYDRNNSRLYTKSLNAVPDYVICCKENGTCVPMADGFYHAFTKEEIQQGYISVPSEKLISSYPYFKVLFKTEYGKIVQKPIVWL